MRRTIWAPIGLHDRIRLACLVSQSLGHPVPFWRLMEIGIEHIEARNRRECLRLGRDHDHLASEAHHLAARRRVMRRAKCVGDIDPPDLGVGRESIAPKPPSHAANGVVPMTDDGNMG